MDPSGSEIILRIILDEWHLCNDAIYTFCMWPTVRVGSFATSILPVIVPSRRPLIALCSYRYSGMGFRLNLTPDGVGPGGVDDVVDVAVGIRGVTSVFF